MLVISCDVIHKHLNILRSYNSSVDANVTEMQMLLSALMKKKRTISLSLYAVILT